MTVKLPTCDVKAVYFIKRYFSKTTLLEIAKVSLSGVLLYKNCGKMFLRVKYFRFLNHNQATFRSIGQMIALQNFPISFVTRLIFSWVIGKLWLLFQSWSRVSTKRYKKSCVASSMVFFVLWPNFQSVCWGKFYQHFMSSFCATIFTLTLLAYGVECRAVFPKVCSAGH